MRSIVLSALASAIALTGCVVEDHRPPHRTVVVHERPVVVERPVVIERDRGYFCPPGQAKKGRC